MSEPAKPVRITELLREIYRPQVTLLFPDLVEEYGYDAVWEAMGQAPSPWDREVP